MTLCLEGISLLEILRACLLCSRECSQPGRNFPSGDKGRPFSKFLLAAIKHIPFREPPLDFCNHIWVGRSIAREIREHRKEVFRSCCVTAEPDFDLIPRVRTSL